MEPSQGSQSRNNFHILTLTLVLNVVYLCKVKILHLKYEAIPNSWEQCKEVVQEDESFMNYPFSPPKGSLDKIVQGNLIMFY